MSLHIVVALEEARLFGALLAQETLGSGPAVLPDLRGHAGTALRLVHLIASHVGEPSGSGVRAVPSPFCEAQTVGLHWQLVDQGEGLLAQLCGLRRRDLDCGLRGWHLRGGCTLRVLNLPHGLLPRGMRCVIGLNALQMLLTQVREGVCGQALEP